MRTLDLNWQHPLQEEASGTEWPNYKTVLMDVPCSEETKLEMFNKVPTHLLIPVLKSLVKMSSHVNPVFTDRSVHMMMVVLALFHRYSQCWKKNIHDQNNSTVSIQMKEMWHIKRALFHIIIVTCTLHSEDQDESVRRIHEVIKKNSGTVIKMWWCHRVAQVDWLSASAK